MPLRCIDAMHPYEPFVSLSRDFSYKICPVLTSSHPLTTSRSKLSCWLEPPFLPDPVQHCNRYCEKTTGGFLLRFGRLVLMIKRYAKKIVQASKTWQKYFLWWFFETCQGFFSIFFGKMLVVSSIFFRKNIFFISPKLGQFFLHLVLS